MKRLLLIITIGLSLASFAHADPLQADTVVIELEDGSRIVIYTNSKKELKALQDYDFNKMIADLNNSVDSSSSNYIQLTDEDGNTYKKEAQIIYYDESIQREESDEEYKTRRKREQRFFRSTRNIWNVEIGLTNWLENGEFPNDTDAPYAIRSWAPWYLGLSSNYLSPIGGPFFVKWGFGVTWSNFKFQDDDILLIEDAEAVSFVPADPSLEALRSKLNVVHLNVTAVPMLDFGESRTRNRRGRWRSKSNARVGLGGYVGYRIGSSTKFVFKENGDKERDRTRDNFFLSNVRYGMRLQFGYRAFDLFANYDLNEVFVAGRGPELNAFSFGIIF